MGRSLASATVLLSLGLLVVGLPEVGFAHRNPQEGQKSCPRGSVAGVIGGVRKCLRSGQACKRALDRQYHRYGFHCHTGRLTKAAKPKPPTVFDRRIDVGGYRLAISCRGSAAPTVILESGSGTAGVTWAVTQAKLASTTRVCYYDRAGLGDSDQRSPGGPAPAAKVVEELHTLLGRAGIPAPYVLGGWSLGGFFVRLYAKRYPSEVLGLVTVDGTPVGLPASAWPNPPGKPDDDLWPSPNESILIRAADDELAASPGLGARPLIVLVRGQRDESTADELQLWLKLQQQVARLSSSSMLVRADNSGHSIQEEATDLTVEALRQVVAAARAAAALPACGSTPLTRFGGTCLDVASRD
jgi:pimeloyl-ACP methyl ester carboxylesterase